jgi:signal transduction histidine kinase/CheY-like chemotaxis protein
MNRLSHILRVFQRIGQQLEERQTFLQLALGIATLTCIIEGSWWQLYTGKFVEPWPLRVVMILVMATAWGTTFTPYWLRTERFRWVVYALMGAWTLAVLFFNGFIFHIQFEIVLVLVGVGFVLDRVAYIYQYYLLHFVMTSAMLFMMEAPLDQKIDFGMEYAMVAALSLVVIVNLHRSRQRLEASVSNQQALNHTLTHTNRILEKAQQIARVGHWEILRETNEIFWSKEVYRILEVPLTHPLTEAFVRSLHLPASWQLLDPALRACSRQGTPFDLKLEVHTHQGAYRVVRCMGYRDPDTQRIFGVVQDITHEQQQAQALQETTQKAEAEARAKTDFLSTMSHEIRTPMNAVIGMAHVLQQESPRSDQVEHLRTLMFSAENLLSLVNDILDFSKIEAGRVTLEQIDFHLPEKIEYLVRAMRVQLKDRPVELRLHLSPHIPTWVKGDPMRLTQILNNLLSNALKFTRAGHVTLSVSDLAQANGQYQLTFEVIDTGIGIPADKLETIFDSFEQASLDTNRHFGGTGLGLAITRRLVHLMDSEVQVHSQEGQGSTFAFTLWLKAGIPQVPIKVPERLAVPSGMRLLLVEDNPVNLKVANHFLERWGYQVDTATHGEEAVQQVRSQSYDLILMDLQMPRMDGWEATQHIRRLDARVPIVALTAEASREVHERVLAAGMNDYASKPFNPEELRQKIGRLLMEVSVG